MGHNVISELLCEMGHGNLEAVWIDRRANETATRSWFALRVLCRRARTLADQLARQASKLTGLLLAYF